MALQPVLPRRPLHPHVRRHTRMVVTMRYALPVTAALLLTAITLWTQLGGDSGLFRLAAGRMLAGLPDSLTMSNPRFDGIDQKQRPFSVFAQLASQADKDGNVIDLTSPEADVTIDGGAWLAINAESGRYLRKEQKLDLNGAVSLFHDQGFELHTRDVQVDLATSTARTAQPVQGQGPSGNLAADGMVVQDGGKRVFLLGRSKVMLYGGDQVSEAPKQ
jgi:lipopolysaccharide export system protein LptC